VAGTKWNLCAADEIPPSDGYLLVDTKKCQGWDESSGYPKRNTLESLELGYVADELEKNEKLGQE
jgi:hypothetical protein